MKGFIAWWIKNPVAANLLMVATIFMGIVGFNKLEREFIPSMTFNGMSVSMAWQGASPSDISEQLVTRIEDAVNGLDGIDYIESTAQEGFANVNIRTKVRADYERLFDEVKIRVDGINNFPPDAFRPSVTRWDARPDYMYMALYGDLDRYTLQRMGTQIRDEMAKLPGGELVEDISKLDEEVTIEISEEALRRFGMTFSQVAQAIRGNSVNLSAGDIETSAGNLQLKARNLANSADDFGDIVIRQSADGGKVYLRDIAKIIDGFQDVEFDATFRGKEAIMFRALTPDTINITKAGKAFRDYIDKKNEELPPGVEMAMWFDGSTVFDARMHLIGSNSLMGMGLVLVILLLFLRPWVALWVTSGILVAFLGAIALMPYLGISLNMMSTFAILLVIGIVVDDAIVVGESIHFHTEHGVTGFKAAAGGTNMVVKPVFFAVITTIMMFLPWMLLSVPQVAITRQISLVVIAALTFSLIESFFILPAHLRHLKKPKPAEDEMPLMRLQRKLADGLNNVARKVFRPFGAFVVRWRYGTVAFFIGLFLIAQYGIVATGIAKTEIFPNPEGDMVQVQIRFPEGTNFERLKQVKDKLRDAVVKVNENAEKDFGVDFELITAPGSFASSFNGRSNVQAFLGLAPAEKRTHVSSNKIAEKLEEYLGPVPDAQRVTMNADQGGGSSSNTRIVIFGITSSDEAQLKNAISDISKRLESYSSVTRTFDSLESSAQEMRFTLKPGAARYGLTLSDVTRQVREAIFGLEVQRLPRNGEDVRVVLRYPKLARESLDTLKNLRIRATGGVEVPLYSVADVEFAPGVSRITRRDRKRTVRVGARVKGGPAAINQIKTDMSENFFPNWDRKYPHVEQLVIDADDEARTFFSELKLYTILIFAAMYGLLAIAFKSYAQPLLIMVAIPFAYVGLVIGSVIMNIPMSMMSIFGFFAAAGVAVNDNLVLIDYINRLRSKGIGAYQAVLDACVARFRPILLTSVTTFIGIMPMFAEKSVQAQFIKPMVVALAFGVLFDFFLTLILVPAMYGIGVDIRRLFLRLWTGQKQPGLGASYDPELAVALEDYEVEEIMHDADEGFDKPSPTPAE